MKKKTAPSALLQQTTDPVTEVVRAARLLAGNAVTALRVVGKDVQLPMPLAKSSFTLGRAAATEVDLSIPHRDVSRLHCILRRSGSELTVTDAGSTNGVEVRGHGGPGSFRAGERLVVGSTELIALDDAMQALRPVLLRYLGFRAHAAADDALTMLAGLDAAAGRDEKAILLIAPRGSETEALARAIHEASARRRRGFATLAASATTDRDVTAALKAASHGTIHVDLSGVATGRAPASLVSALVANTFRARAIIVAIDPVAAHAATAPTVLPWERIVIPAIAARAAEIPHLLNAMMVELGSQRRVEELAADRIAALSSYAWPENHHDLRRAADRLRTLLEHDGNVSAAARALTPAVTPASLTEYLVRIGALAGKRR